MMLLEMRNMPIGGQIRAVVAETARSDCTLQNLCAAMPNALTRAVANNIEYARAA